MAEISYPWQGITIGDAGPYSSGQWQTKQAVGGGLAGHRPGAGYLLGSGDAGLYGLRVLQSSPTAATVRVFPGSALVQGIYYRLTAAMNLAIAANSSGNPRIDLVVLRVDYAAQTVRLAVKTGTPAASPVRPNLTQSAGVTWEIALADVAVASGFVVINAADVTFIGEPANGPPAVILDDILNNSGGELKTGDVVVWDTGTNLAVTVSTDIYKGAGRVAGVWQGLNANGTRGKVMVKGISFVLVNGAVAVNDQISLHSVAREGITGKYATFARARQSQASTGYIQCYVDAGHEYGSPKLYAECVVSPAQAIANAGALVTVANWIDGGFKTVPAMHSDGTNPERLVTPRVGLWFFSAYLEMANTDGTYRAVYLNDAAGGTVKRVREPTTAAGANALNLEALVFAFNGSTDYFTLIMQHDAPANRNLLTTSWVRWVFLGDGSL